MSYILLTLVWAVSEPESATGSYVVRFSSPEHNEFATRHQFAILDPLACFEYALI